MGGEHAFLTDVIEDLDASLDAAGVTNRSYGIVGFGSGLFLPEYGDPRTIGGTLNNAAVTKANFGSLLLSGATEDGYEAINYALNAFNYTPGAAINYVLVTDEDRDVTSSDTYASILGSLSGSNILLNAIVNNGFRSDNFTSGVLGINDDGDAYVADGAGGFVTDTGGIAITGSTKTDYVDLALASGGAAWNLNLLRSGGASADSFAASFIDIKVSEIISQPPSPPTNPIPLPAAAWMLMAGIAGLGAVGARKRKTA